MSHNKTLLLATVSLLALFPTLALACACGCGVFEVGTGIMMPTVEGGSVWLEYDYMNQSQNWSGTSSAPKANNEDKQIRTNFITAGAQYMFNRSWGIEGQLPYWERHFKTTTDNPNPGNTAMFEHADIGDIRLKGIYAGFSEDMSTGVTFGLKLPSGNFSYAHFDRDTAIGTGSTDLLLGAYHQASLSEDFNWFVNGEVSHAMTIQDHYRPGDEADAALGSYYTGLDIGKAGTISPLLQIIGSVRKHDIGANAATDANGAPQSGYQRLLISPGIEYAINQVKLYGDVEVPFYQHVNGNQLTAPVLFKFIVGYSF